MFPYDGLFDNSILKILKPTGPFDTIFGPIKRQKNDIMRRNLPVASFLRSSFFVFCSFPPHQTRTASTHTPYTGGNTARTARREENKDKPRELPSSWEPGSAATALLPSRGLARTILHRVSIRTKYLGELGKNIDILPSPCPVTSVAGRPATGVLGGRVVVVEVATVVVG